MYSPCCLIRCLFRSNITIEFKGVVVLSLADDGGVALAAPAAAVRQRPASESGAGRGAANGQSDAADGAAESGRAAATHARSTTASLQLAGACYNGKRRRGASVAQSQPPSARHVPASAAAARTTSSHRGRRLRAQLRLSAAQSGQQHLSQPSRVPTRHHEYVGHGDRGRNRRLLPRLSGENRAIRPVVMSNARAVEE